MFAVMTPEQFAHVNVGTTPAHPNAMCIAETIAVVAGEPHAREFVRRLQNQGKAAPHGMLSPGCCACLMLHPGRLGSVRYPALQTSCWAGSMTAPQRSETVFEPVQGGFNQ